MVVETTRIGNIGLISSTYSLIPQEVVRNIRLVCSKQVPTTATGLGWFEVWVWGDSYRFPISFSGNIHPASVASMDSRKILAAVEVEPEKFSSLINR